MSVHYSVHVKQLGEYWNAQLHVSSNIHDEGRVASNPSLAPIRTTYSLYRACNSLDVFFRA
jgi:hypothetical protein